MAGDSKTDPSSSGSPVRTSNFHRCRQFILNKAHRCTTLEEQAKALNHTPSDLCRLYREYGAVRPYQLLIRTNMNFGLDRLILSQGTMKQGCYKSGFTNPDHFSRLFKKVHELPPSELASRML